MAPGNSRSAMFQIQTAPSPKTTFLSARLGASVAMQHALAGRVNDLLNSRDHLVELTLGLAERFLRTAFDALGNLMGKLSGLPDDTGGGVQQRHIGLFQLLFAALGLVATGTGNGEDPKFDRARSIPQASAGLAGYLADPLHDSRQDPHAVAQQTAIGWIVDVCLHYRSVDTQFTARGDLLFERDLDHPLMQLFNDIRTELPRQSAQRFVIRHFAAAYTSKLAVDQIRSYFPRHIRKAPVAKMLQQKHAQDDLRRRGGAPTRLALLASLGQFPLNDQQQFLVLQRLIGMTHPG